MLAAQRTGVALRCQSYYFRAGDKATLSFASDELAMPVLAGGGVGTVVSEQRLSDTSAFRYVCGSEWDVEDDSCAVGVQALHCKNASEPLCPLAHAQEAIMARRRAALQNRGRQPDAVIATDKKEPLPFKL